LRHTGASHIAFKVDAFSAADTDVDVVSVYPHMHLLGTKTKVEAKLADGTTVCMIDVPQYDFNWQGQYVYKTPLHIAVGGVLHVESHFDNSTDNWHNPTPRRKTCAGANRRPTRCAWR
jgi:hypothetical protein